MDHTYILLVLFQIYLSWVSVGLTLVTAIIQVDKVLLVLFGEGCGVNCITVVLTGDMTLPSRQVQGWDIVGTVSVLELDSTGTGC